MKTNQKINGIIACLQEHAQTIDSSKDLKQFFESNFKFDGYYSIDESYRDFFVSESYLSNEVTKCIARNEKAFIDTLRKCVGTYFWNKHKNEIEPTREYSEKDAMYFVFKDLEDVDYTKFHEMQDTISYRIAEMKRCYKAKAYLSVIILAGSVLEALLVSLYRTNEQLFINSLNNICSTIQNNNMNKDLGETVKLIKKNKVIVVNEEIQNPTELKSGVIDSFRLSLERLIWEFKRKTHPNMPEFSINTTESDKFKLFFKKQKDDLNKENFEILITLSFYIGILMNEYSFVKANELREYRNYIHPAKQNDNIATFTADEIKAKSFISNLSVVLKDIVQWDNNSKNY